VAEHRRAGGQRRQPAESLRGIDRPAHRRPRGRHSYLIAIGVAAAVILGAAGIAVGYAPGLGKPAAQVSALTVDRSTQRASRDYPRTEVPSAVASPSSASPSPSPSSASPSPSPSDSPSASPTSRRTTPATKPTTKAAITAGCSSFSGNQLIACDLLPSYGFSTSEMSALVPMWTNESGWNQYAENPSSGAYGIPQALPGNKMASVASDWQTNPTTQIKWGLGYIKQVYGTPSSAWSFWQANNWY
jgi:hypothetical protein